jgi:hypothetical protein
MSNGDLNWLANFIWGIADDVLRDLYVRGKYRDVILPMTVLRRLDAVLEPSKPAVLAMKASLDKAGVVSHAFTTAGSSATAYPLARLTGCAGSNIPLQIFDIFDLEGYRFSFPEERLDMTLDPARIHLPGGWLYPVPRIFLIAIAQLGNRQRFSLRVLVGTRISALIDGRELQARFLARLIGRQRTKLSNRVFAKPAITVSIHDDPRHRARSANP